MENKEKKMKTAKANTKEERNDNKKILINSGKDNRSYFKVFSKQFVWEKSKSRKQEKLL